MSKEDFLGKIPKLEKVYIIQSGYTKNPFVICDELSFDDKILVFINEEEAKNKIEELNKDNNNVSYITISQKDLPNFIASLELYGINAINFVDNNENFIYQIQEIVKVPIRDDKTVSIFENPNLAITMTYFMQELRKKDKNADIEKLKNLEEEMIVNIMRAKFLLPTSKMDEETKKSSLLMIKTENNEALIPVFTDHIEFNRFKKNLEAELKMIDFKEMAHLKLPENTFAFIINPAGIGVLVTKAWLEKIKENMFNND